MNIFWSFEVLPRVLYSYSTWSLINFHFDITASLPHQYHKRAATCDRISMCACRIRENHNDAHTSSTVSTRSETITTISLSETTVAAAPKTCTLLSPSFAVFVVISCTCTSGQSESRLYTIYDPAIETQCVFVSVGGFFLLHSMLIVCLCACPSRVSGAFCRRCWLSDRYVGVFFVVLLFIRISAVLAWRFCVLEHLASHKSRGMIERNRRKCAHSLRLIPWAVCDQKCTRALIV